VQALAARRESDTLVREGGGDARCNVHFLVHHDRQRRRRWSTVDLDHHRTTMVGYGKTCGRHFRVPSPFRWLAPDVYRSVIYETGDVRRSTSRRGYPVVPLPQEAFLTGRTLVRLVIAARDVSLAISHGVRGKSFSQKMQRIFFLEK